MGNPPIDETAAPAPLALRPARWDDLEAVAALIYAVCEEDGDTSVAVTPQDLANEWRNEGFDLERDTFVVAAPGAGLVGYAELYEMEDHTDLRGDLYVLRDFKQAGASDLLIGAICRRAEAHTVLAAPGRRVSMRVTVDNRDEDTKGRIERAGFTPLRYHWRMGIEIDAAPPAPVLPGGLEFRPFRREEHARQVLQARNEAFQDHWGSHLLDMEQFTHYHFDNPEYDPSLWALIWDGDELAGFSINRYRMGVGWIQTLGVRRPWRRQGLGLALLAWSFGAFYRRGTRDIGLGVDAANPTGATELYRKAGMRAVSEFASYGKELRPGIAAEKADEPG